uniref:Ig-like domain-containing protein n=1 Tax=Sphaeramia orbicularis TaxID=375764 RepID=A0A673BGQ1_9TELE
MDPQKLSATVSVIPNRSQFFWYESITLSCPGSEKSSGWTLMRNTSNQIFEPCNSWGISNDSSCTIEDTYPSDTGVYWCQSERGECTNTINITVPDSGVILHSPASPAKEGEKVSLHCSYRETINQVSSNFTANFYKAELFIGSRPDGKISFPTVGTSDEGFYKCKHPTKGESPQSWLSVREKQPHNLPPPPPLPSIMSLPRMVCTVLLIILYIVLTIVCVKAHQQWKKGKTLSIMI